VSGSVQEKASIRRFGAEQFSVANVEDPMRKVTISVTALAVGGLVAATETAKAGSNVAPLTAGPGVTTPVLGVVVAPPGSGGFHGVAVNPGGGFHGVVVNPGGGFHGTVVNPGGGISPPEDL
jgi:hypothetical protein